MWCRVTRREPGRVRFRIGQVIRHLRYGYRGVVTGWDARCLADDIWVVQMGVEALPSAHPYHFDPKPYPRPHGVPHRGVPLPDGRRLGHADGRRSAA